MQTIYFATLVGINLVIGALLWYQLYAIATASSEREPGARRWARMLLWVLPFWFALALGFASSPIFEQPWTTPFGRLALLLGVGVPIAVGLGALALQPHRAVVAQITPAWMIGLHVLRAPVGALFVWLAVQGQLPTAFGFAAGVGDVVAGLLAAPLALAFRRGSNPRRIALAWNLFGLLDLINALRLGVTAVLPFLIATQTSGTITIVPLFGVPLFLVGHMYLFRTLLARSDQPALVMAQAGR